MGYLGILYIVGYDVHNRVMMSTIGDSGYLGIPYIVGYDVHNRVYIYDYRTWSVSHNQK